MAAVVLIGVLGTLGVLATVPIYGWIGGGMILFFATVAIMAGMPVRHVLQVFALMVVLWGAACVALSNPTVYKVLTYGTKPVQRY